LAETNSLCKRLLHHSASLPAGADLAPSLRDGLQRTRLTSDARLRSLDSRHIDKADMTGLSEA
jgi:hypothetical protein